MLSSSKEVTNGDVEAWNSEEPVAAAVGSGMVVLVARRDAGYEIFFVVKNANDVTEGLQKSARRKKMQQCT